MDYLPLACKHLGIDPALVIKSRVDPGLAEFILLADYGIGGVKKYRVPLAHLPEPEPEPAPEPEPEPTPKRGRRAK